jgi:archaellum component FlaC
MATPRTTEMKERITKVEAVIGEFRDHFAAVDRRFDDVDRHFGLVDQRLDSIDRRLDSIDRRLDAVDDRFDAVDNRFEAVDRRFDELEQRLNSRIDLQVERLEQLVTTTAEGFGGVLASIERELREFRAEMRDQSRQTSLILANHEARRTRESAPVFVTD